MTMRRRSPVRRRLRARRTLAAFLKIYREAGKPAEVFEAARVERMLRSGQSADAEHYLESFLPPIPVMDRSQLSILLRIQIRVFRILSKVAAGGPSGAWMAAMFANPSEYVLQSPYNARLFKIIAGMHADNKRASMLWQKVEPYALDNIMGMVARCPELQGEVRLPRKRPLLWDAAPDSLRQCPSRCKNTAIWAPLNVLIRNFLRKRLLLIQGKTHSGNASSQSAVPHTKKERSAPQPAVPTEGVSHSPVVHHIPYTIVSPTETLASSHQLPMQRPMVNAETPAVF
ncbi:unnamed protein product [Urochloa decumbens]|uniref:Uncharacterized protein n=1 Tax=Urochloa decumbens TaxID=240449 RepID=A0ABC8YJM1_9POAL